MLSHFKWSSFVDVAASVAVIVAAGFVIHAARNLSAATARSNVSRVANPGSPVRVDTSTALGNPLATVGLVIYSDFQCPFCGSFARETFPRVKNEFVDRGTLRVFFHHLPLERIHAEAVHAAVGAACAGKMGRFCQMHDILFAEQRRLNRASIVDGAIAIGLDRARFLACFEGQGIEQVRSDLSKAKNMGLRGTPTLQFGRLLPDGSIRVMKSLVGAVTFDAVAEAVRAVK